MIGLSVSGQQTIGASVTIFGTVSDRGMPEPITVDSVTVGGVAAQLTLPVQRGRLWVRSFSARIQRPAGSTVKIVAIDELGLRATADVTVDAVQAPNPRPPFRCALIDANLSITTNVHVGNPFQGKAELSFVLDFDRTGGLVYFQKTELDTDSDAPGGIFGEVFFGHNTSTITQPAGPDSCTYDKTTGSLSMGLMLRIDHSRSFFGIDESSDLNIRLSTDGPTGLPVSHSPMNLGAVTLTGSALLSRGYLSGEECTMVISGASMTPVP
jgi:hypothetical protein